MDLMPMHNGQIAMSEAEARTFRKDVAKRMRELADLVESGGYMNIDWEEEHLLHHRKIDSRTRTAMKREHKGYEFRVKMWNDEREAI